MATSIPAAADPAPELPDYIVKTRDICGGPARIAGTRIKVKHVYTWVERMGMTLAQVVAEYPHLTMAQVHAALAYYWSHREEIHQAITSARWPVPADAARFRSHSCQPSRGR